MAVCALFISSCSNDSTPSKAAKKYVSYFGKGDYEKFVEGVETNPEATPEEVKESQEQLVNLLKSKGEESLKENGKIKNVEVVSEEISEDGTKAVVVLKQEYENGTSKEQSFDMVLQDKKWKVSLGK